MEFIYQNGPIVDPLFNYSQGTEFESARHGLVNLEVQGAKKSIEVLKEKKVEINDLSDDEPHVLYATTCMLLFEVITHKCPYNKALNFTDMVETAMNPDWRRIIK